MPICRLTLKLCALLCWAFAFNAQAQLASLPSAGIALSSIEVLHNVPQGLTLAQVQSGQAGAFTPQNDLYIYHPHWNRALWLKLQFQADLSPAQALQPAVLMLPKPYLDRVSLYTPSAKPGEPFPKSWPVQQAGDFFEPSVRPMRSFNPTFDLPAPADAAWQGGKDLVLYLQIDHVAPVMLNLELADAMQAKDRDLLTLVMYSMGLGAILLAALLTAAMAWLHRDAIYAWYSAYAVFAALASASHSGLAQNLLWPMGGYWPGTAVLCFVLLCGFCQLQFCVALNAQRITAQQLRYFAHTISALSVALAIGFVVFTPYWKALYFATLPVLGSAMVVSVWLMIVGWRAGHQLAGAWLLAFIPLFGTIALGFLEGSGLLPSTYLSYNVAIYAAILEVLILGLALQWFYSERLGELERRRALATVDPLTGFVAKPAFDKQLAHDWAISRRKGRLLAVAYVQLQTRANSEQHLQQLLTRSVRILRSATSAQDVVARLDGVLLALMIHDVSLGDDLNQKLSRIVALGLMPDASDRSVSVLQFRIAVTTSRQFKKPVEELDAQMRQLLAQPSGWGSKPIRYIDHTQKPSINPFALDSVALEETWEAAFKQEAAGSTLQGSSSSR
jgi:GGDEF domain-containing protein